MNHYGIFLSLALFTTSIPAFSDAGEDISRPEAKVPNFFREPQPNRKQNDMRLYSNVPIGDFYFWKDIFVPAGERILSIKDVLWERSFAMDLIIARTEGSSDASALNISKSTKYKVLGQATTTYKTFQFMGPSAPMMRGEAYHFWLMVEPANGGQGLGIRCRWTDQETHNDIGRPCTVDDLRDAGFRFAPTAVINQ